MKSTPASKFAEPKCVFGGLAFFDNKNYHVFWVEKNP
jgi:hypothetical protein